MASEGNLADLQPYRGESQVARLAKLRALRRAQEKSDDTGEPLSLADATQQITGMAPRTDRLGILPKYSRDAGWVAPQILYEAAKAVNAPGAALRGAGDVTEEDALNLAGLVMSGSFAGARPGGLGMGGRAKKPTGDLAAVAEDFVGPPNTRNEVLEAFGSKHEREAIIRRKVLKAALEAEGAAYVAPVNRGKQGKKDAAIYRTLADEQGDDAAMAIFRAGGHLKPDGHGGYIGAPRTVTNSQGLTGMRTALDNQFREGVTALNHADPDRPTGTWYPRAKDSIEMMSEPYQIPRTLNQHAVYSAGVSPEIELGFALKHQNSRLSGEPTMAYRGAPMRQLDNADAAYANPRFAAKVGEYRNKLNPEIPVAGLFGVNDFRAAQGYGYTDVSGKPWKAGVTSTMHPFMDAENALTVDRANRDMVGGKTDWVGPNIQEVPWIYAKAQDIYSRANKKKGRFAGRDGPIEAIREANNTQQDYMYKHAAAATNEAIPGKSTGHVPSILDAPLAEREAYSKTGNWVGEDNKDALYRAAGFRQLSSLQSSGMFRNSAGQIEYQPMNMNRPLFDFPTLKAGDPNPGLVSPTTMKTAGAIERIRALLDAQEAGAVNLPNTSDSVSGKLGLLMDSRPKGDRLTGVQPTADELGGLAGVIEGAGLGKRFGVTPTNRGASVIPYITDGLDQQAQRELKKLSPALQAIFNSNVMPARHNISYVPGIGKWGESGVVPTAPFSGEATGGALAQLAESRQNVARNLGESDEVRRMIRQKTARDDALPGARQDIQNMRRFFSEADWPKAVELIRSGLTPAAAVAALGYSLNSMAADPPRK